MAGVAGVECVSSCRCCLKTLRASETEKPVESGLIKGAGRICTAIPQFASRVAYSSPTAPKESCEARSGCANSLTGLHALVRHFLLSPNWKGLLLDWER